MTQTVVAEVAAKAPKPVGGSPYVFVVGCPRSGTTLLQRMLDNHPMLAVANDTHFIPRAIDGLAEKTNPPVTAELVNRVQNYHRFHRLGLSSEAVNRAADGAETYSAFVSALYAELAGSRGKPLAGEKTPDYVRHLPLLHTLFPHAKIIHIIRDGRDVALSVLEWAHEKKGPGRLALWKQNPLATCALWWSRLVESGRADGQKLGSSHYREVLYEDLVTKPEQTLRGLASFLELPYTPEMVSYHVGRVRHESGLSAKKSWLPPTPGLRDWRSDMSARNTELFEALAGDLLSELGYERATQSPSPEIAKIADRCQESWAAEKKSRRDKLRRKRPSLA